MATKGKGKDLSEKLLEQYNDVFADIVNGIVFRGKSGVKPEALSDTTLEAAYRSIGTGKLRSMERDVAKIWSEKGVKIALCGLENQTKAERYMPLRIMGYEGASYRDMLRGNNPEVFPVISLILYFGETHWKEPRTLSGVLQKKSCPRELNDFLNEVKLNICEVSFLSEEELSCFHSDFRVVAEFFVRKRQDPLYIPQDKEKIRHVQEVLTLLSTVTGDSRYTQVLENNIEEVQSMCDVAQRLENIGRQKGFTEGIQEGRQEGEVKMLFRLTASGVLTMNEALREAAPLGIKDKDDFVRQAEKAGFTVNG